MNRREVLLGSTIQASERELSLNEVISSILTQIYLNFIIGIQSNSLIIYTKLDVQIGYNFIIFHIRRLAFP